MSGVDVGTTLGRAWCLLLLGLLAVALSCALKQERPPPGPPLRVGTLADTPPIAFQQNGQPAGIEIDLANHLSVALNRPLTLVPMGHEQLVPALVAGSIDVIMAGMPIPTTHDFRLTFGRPYLFTGLATLLREADAQNYRSPAMVMNTSGKVGVVANARAASFVAADLPSARPVPFPGLDDAVQALRDRRVDMVIAQAHLLGWYARNDPGLAGLWALLDRDQLAWAFRVRDTALRDAASAVLAGWEQDGTLNRVLLQWLPYWPRLR
jgi:polar amino acid transport system substrate-binding protein